MFSFRNIHINKDNGSIHVVADINMKRFEEQFTLSQFLLDSEIMTDMSAYMPLLTSTFINETKAMSAAIAGSGYVYAAAPPYGRFLYYGKNMVSPTTGSTYARLGEKKVLVSQYKGKTNAKEMITLHRSTKEVEPEWFEVAKKRYGRKWIRHAKEVAGDG